jgi:hypothetical protein
MVDRWRAAGVAGVSLAAGLALFAWVRGPVRGFVGDVLVIVFLVACLATTGRGTARGRLLAIGALALGTELFQGLGVVPEDAPWWVHLTVGATFDPVDFLAYLLGLGAAFGAERAWARTP